MLMLRKLNFSGVSFQCELPRSATDSHLSFAVFDTANTYMRATAVAWFIVYWQMKAHPALMLQCRSLKRP